MKRERRIADGEPVAVGPTCDAAVGCDLDPVVKTGNRGLHFVQNSERFISSVREKLIPVAHDGARLSEERRGISGTGVEQLACGRVSHSFVDNEWLEELPANVSKAERAIDEEIHGLVSSRKGLGFGPSLSEISIAQGQRLHLPPTLG